MMIITKQKIFCQNSKEILCLKIWENLVIRNKESKCIFKYKIYTPTHKDKSLKYL